MELQRVTISELEARNKANSLLLDKFNNEITTDPNAKEVILYHGTRASYRKILKEGLLIRAGLHGRDTKMKMIDDVLQREFGVTRQQVPDWIWKNEYEYEKTIEPHLHMSINFGTAAGYSHQGCEIKAQVRDAMYCWLLTRRYGDITCREQQKLFPNVSVSQLACERNGKHSYVFQVKLPISFLRDQDLVFWREILTNINELMITHEECEPRKTLEETTMEIRCLRNIRPKMITQVWEIKWDNNWASKFLDDSYKVVQLFPSKNQTTPKHSV